MTISTHQQSSLIYGCMGLGGGWDNSTLSAAHVQQAHEVIDAALDANIRTFDHADIYTLGKAEQVFGQVLSQRPELKDLITLQSKCAIRFADQHGPNRYDFSKKWIIDAVDNILTRLGIEQLDTLLLHRPDPLMVPDEVADAVEYLQSSGKIAHLGVSNMNVHQIRFLQSALNTPIVCSQLEMSLTQLNWLEESITPFASSALGTLEYCQMKQISLQAWGSLSQGLFSGRDVSQQPDNIRNTANVVASLAQRHEASKEAIVLAWLMRHPANIQPVIGTTNPQRILACGHASDIKLSREEWYLLYESARGHAVP
ncbi:aldo/keto reductase [Vibrio sp. 10N.286.49.C2]|uniref:aldo/keto reductase n=1 Tax=unclassified Vibrio TaxID=2614977 RepID=UPI000C8181F2|nr:MULTISPECIES: aldo/keto reductase [unclassified Vibrio]PMH35199.1 aldo/keto reductase [Vibrio sp. 10N.286.49.C2]PMH57142.1 aldo/keto reductase [Vibrio sp. 10N.286.49.B1]PMH82346.1 aldo/keto reductase [Vibrio sp. 10N.286.48.B7]